MKEFLEDHLRTLYHCAPVTSQAFRSYWSDLGWRDYYIGDHLLFSHRETLYNYSNFPEKFHTHDFYEMDILIRGHVAFIADNREFIPAPADIMLLPPKTLHTARLLKETEYERYVFGFSRNVFSFLGANSLGRLFGYEGGVCLTIHPEKMADLYFLLHQINHTCQTVPADAGALLYSYILKLFYLITWHASVNEEGTRKIPQHVLEIKTYIDENYADIISTADIANHSHFSREYVSRFFRQYFNTTISEYITSKRIERAKRLLEDGETVTQAFSHTGYSSMSAFIQAFKKHTGLAPSQYAARARKNARL